MGNKHISHQSNEAPLHTSVATVTEESLLGTWVGNRKKCTLLVGIYTKKKEQFSSFRIVICSTNSIPRHIQEKGDTKVRTKMCKQFFTAFTLSGKIGRMQTVISRCPCKRILHLYC